jgi:hypothetical protein
MFSMTPACTHPAKEVAPPPLFFYYYDYLLDQRQGQGRLRATTLVAPSEGGKGKDTVAICYENDTRDTTSGPAISIKLGGVFLQ